MKVKDLITQLMLLDQEKEILYLDEKWVTDISDISQITVNGQNDWSDWEPSENGEYYLIS